MAWLEYDRWYDVEGGRVLREAGSWWTIETAAGRSKRTCEVPYGDASTLSFDSEEMANVFARAVKGRVFKTGGERALVLGKWIITPVSYRVLTAGVVDEDVSLVNE